MVLALFLKTLCLCYLRMRSSQTTYCKVQRHFEVILSSLWYVLYSDIQEDTGIKTALRCIEIRSLAQSTSEFYELTRVFPVKYI